MKVVSMWTGPLTKIQKLCVQSFIQNGLEFDLYTYDSIPDVVSYLKPVVGKPGGSLVVLDARAVLPETDIFHGPHVDGEPGAVTGFSDIWRFKYLYEHAGIWVDMDMLSSGIDLQFYLSDRPAVPMETPEQEGCCVLFAPARGDPFFGALLEGARHVFSRPYRFGDGGPRLVKEVARAFPYVRRWDPYVFCSLPCSRATDVTLDSFAFTAGPAVHLWHEMWRARKVDPDGTYPATCMYEQWKNQYGV